MASLSRLLVPVLWLAALATAAGEHPLSMPSWLVPYPGVSADTRTLPGLLESSYETTAPPIRVITHYHGLLVTAALRYRQTVEGGVTSIRTAALECDVLVQIRPQGAGTFVQVDCTARGPVDPAAITAAAKGDKGLQGMEKYDRPVSPQSRPHLPPLVWPSWLISCDGGALEVYKGVDVFKLSFLKAEFDSTSDRAAIQAYYADLLNSHGYPVSMQSSRITPLDRKALVEGIHLYGDTLGPRFVIRAELTPTEGAVHVELRITARP